MIALAEFISTKRHNLDRTPVRGRCDLWICDETSWAFEFKQVHYEGTLHRTKTIRSWLESACRDARRLKHHEADQRFGALVISTYRADHIEQDFLDNIAEVIVKADFAWQIRPGSEFASDTFILFKEVHKKRTPKTKRASKAD